MGRGNKPVINVSWYDAIKYCNWLSEREGLTKAYDSKGNLPEDLQRIVIELKLKHNKALESIIEVGLEQTATYMDKTGAKEAYLIIFDRENANWDERIFIETRTYEQMEIIVFGM